MANSRKPALKAKNPRAETKKGVVAASAPSKKLPHVTSAELKKLVKKYPPPQSWYDEPDDIC
ncbi:MAG TPA: hypothetical protein VE988_24095 [Gemmataceae bacterium]|nr:hypothetical protein [Gemmataceae bacterium]